MWKLDWIIIMDHWHCYSVSNVIRPSSLTDIFRNHNDRTWKGQYLKVERKTLKIPFSTSLSPWPLLFLLMGVFSPNIWLRPPRKYCSERNFIIALSSWAKDNFQKISKHLLMNHCKMFSFFDQRKFPTGLYFTEVAHSGIHLSKACHASGKYKQTNKILIN